MATPYRPADLVLFADESLIVINKPAGLLTLPDGYDPQKPFVQSLLQPEFGRLWIVHRLDRETSGALLLARDADTHRALNSQFQERQVEKVYHALVVGNPPWEVQSTHLPLRVNGDRRHRTVIDPGRGKAASTDFRVLEAFDGYALVEARPHTGYTHQIRAHLSALGLPLAGDWLYAKLQTAALPGLERTALHAQRLSFLHPSSREMCSFSAPYPQDFLATLAFLRREKNV